MDDKREDEKIKKQSRGSQGDGSYAVTGDGSFSVTGTVLLTCPKDKSKEPSPVTEKEPSLTEKEPSLTEKEPSP